MEDRYISFLVRVWIADAGQRVEVQHIQSGDCVTFDSLRAAWVCVLDRCALSHAPEFEKESHHVRDHENR